ncbi:MAG: acid--CoA ligase [Rhodospirillaceae bacterium]|nr:MAG: acid--CoA ligase [Rhodospirillaceae bacterium]
MTNEILLGDVPERNAARLGPDRWAVRHDDDVLTWGELADRVLRRAHALAAAGVRQDDFVVLALPNSNALYELTFALWKLGATPSIVSPRLPHAELTPIIETVGARLVIAHDPAIVAATGALPADFGRDHPDTTPLVSRLAKHWKAMTSGGSTGRPKVIIDHNTSRFAVGEPFLLLQKDGVMLNPAPLYHNFPFAVTHSAMLHGISVVGMTKFDAAKLLQLVERHKVQWVNLVPTMMNRIARLPDDVRQAHDMSSLKAVWHTAAPIPAWLKQMWIDWIGPERIWEMYGGSEGFCVTQLNGVEWLAHRGSVGRPVGGEVRIRGADGATLPPGEVGEVYMRGPSGTRPTYHYLGADSRRLDDGFESLGDYGWVDADGYLYISDRRTDLILCGGSNVYPAEVEAALMEHPRVETAIVIGLPNEDLGSVPHAIIRPEQGAEPPTEEELRAFAAERLVLYKTPRSYEFTGEPLRDEAGKVRRSQLRAARLNKGA